MASFGAFPILEQQLNQVQEADLAVTVKITGWTVRTTRPPVGQQLGQIGKINEAVVGDVRVADPLGTTVKDAIKIAIQIRVVLDLTQVEHSIPIAITRAGILITAVGDTIFVTIFLTLVWNSIAIAIGRGAIADITDIKNAVRVATMTDPLVKIALIRNAVSIAIHAEPFTDVTYI